MLLNNVITKEIRQEDGFLYVYELIVREGEMTADFGLPLYSVRVSMTDSDGNSSQREAKDVFADESRALSFFDKLVRNLATPIDLSYVVEDEFIG